MLIGLYGSNANARAAVARLADRPGFRDHPEIVEDDSQPGFFIVDYIVDEDQWTDGYVSADEREVDVLGDQ